MAGVNVAGTAGAHVFIEVSVITGNNVGVNLKGIGGVANKSFVEHSVVNDNTTAAVQVDGPSSVVLSGSTLTGSPSSIIVTNGGSAVSYGNKGMPERRRKLCRCSNYMPQLFGTMCRTFPGGRGRR